LIPFKATQGDGTALESLMVTEQSLANGIEICKIILVTFKPNSQILGFRVACMERIVSAALQREDLVYMGTSALTTFKILKILKSHTSIFSKIMALNI
jgi:hypothetical protein